MTFGLLASDEIAIERARRTARRQTPEWKATAASRLASSRRRVDKDPAAAMWNRRKVQAKKAGLDFSITKDDIYSVWPKDNICPVLGVAMQRLTQYAPSLDRIRSEVGYVAGNICIISRRANRIKNDGTAAEHRAIATYQDRAEI